MTNKWRENFFRPRGIFKMTVRKAGEIIEVYEDHNMIVNNAKLLMAHLIGGDTSGRSITKIGFGTNNATPLPDNASLTNPYVKQIGSISFPGFSTDDINVGPIFGLPDDLIVAYYGYQVQFDWELLTTEGNGRAISEFGLISENNTLFSRRARNNPIHKESDISIEGSWIITL